MEQRQKILPSSGGILVNGKNKIIYVSCVVKLYIKINKIALMF